MLNSITSEFYLFMLTTLRLKQAIIKWRDTFKAAILPYSDTPSKFALNLMPNSSHALHFRAWSLFQNASPSVALRVLENKKHICKKHHNLAKLYCTALLLEEDRSNRYEEAKAFILKFFETYKGHMWQARGFTRRQRNAIAQNVPSIFVVTLPKSGSLFLMNTLSRGLNAPHTFFCPFLLFSDVLIKERVEQFSQGGAICVDHPDPNDVNLDTLHAHGIRKINFHYRDVRQSTLSMVHHLTKLSSSIETNETIAERKSMMKSDPDFFQYIYFSTFYAQHKYLADWATRIENDKRFEFMITNYDDLDVERNLIARILKFNDVPNGTFDWPILDERKETRAGHFRRGLKDEWKSVLSEKTIEKVDELLEQSQVLQRMKTLENISAKSY